MKRWMQKLLESFDFNLDQDSRSNKATTPHSSFTDLQDGPSSSGFRLSEEKATLLFLIDSYSRHTMDTETLSAKKAREHFEEFAKEIIQAREHDQLEKTLFRFRQFFNSHRIDEYTYVQNTLDDFKTLIWDFIDQLGEELSFELQSNLEMKKSFSSLKDAVESNSIETLKVQARQFIDSYSEIQHSRERRQRHRIQHVQDHFEQIKRQLLDAQNSLKVDYLTQAYNRKTFDEQCKNIFNIHKITKTQGEAKQATLVILDIDHFKKINDSYGHDMGDFILQELVKLLKLVFSRSIDCVARLGGEEFGVLLPDYLAIHAQQKIEILMKKIRSEVFVKEDLRVQFTISAGIAELGEDTGPSAWLKRADVALYEAKKTGRNKFVVAPLPSQTRLSA
jgi:diguanylate cyclase (GGDEF)-like protein